MNSGLSERIFTTQDNIAERIFALLSFFFLSYVIGVGTPKPVDKINKN